MNPLHHARQAVEAVALPEPKGYLHLHMHMGVNQVHGYTAKQMEAYGDARAEARAPTLQRAVADDRAGRVVAGSEQRVAPPGKATRVRASG